MLCCKVAPKYSSFYDFYDLPYPAFEPKGLPSVSCALLLNIPAFSVRSKKRYQYLLSKLWPASCQFAFHKFTFASFLRLAYPDTISSASFAPMQFFYDDRLHAFPFAVGFRYVSSFYHLRP
jgi:hypothetical protein